MRECFLVVTTFGAYGVAFDTFLEEIVFNMESVSENSPE
jgi:hypothetical protein